MWRSAFRYTLVHDERVYINPNCMTRYTKQMKPRIGSTSEFGNPLAAHKLIGQARRFRYTKPIVAGKDDTDRGSQGNAVPDAGVDRLDIVARPQRDSDALAAMQHLACVATVRAWFIEFADQHALRAAHARSVQHQSKMARQADPAGMGAALAVKHEYVRLRFHFPYGGQNRRSFAKGEQTRHVWKSRSGAGGDLFDDCPGSHIPNDDAGHAFIAIRRKCKISAGDESKPRD